MEGAGAQRSAVDAQRWSAPGDLGGRTQKNPALSSRVIWKRGGSESRTRLCEQSIGYCDSATFGKPRRARGLLSSRRVEASLRLARYSTTSRSSRLLRIA